MDERAVQAHDVDVVKVLEPQLLGRQAMLSGEIARTTDYEMIPEVMRVERAGEDVHDTLPGEQAIVYHVKGKGLVVLTACGHAGVVNTVRHAQETTGIDKVHAIVGGFHLSGAPEERIERTSDDLVAFDPDVIVPMHCTGIETINALQQRAPKGDIQFCRYAISVLSDSLLPGRRSFGHAGRLWWLGGVNETGHSRCR